MTDLSVCAGVAVATVDSVGRRPLLLGGVTGLCVSLLALSGAQTLVGGDLATWLSVLGLLSYTAAYQVKDPPLSQAGPTRTHHQNPPTYAAAYQVATTVFTAA